MLVLVSAGMTGGPPVLSFYGDPAFGPARNAPRMRRNKISRGRSVAPCGEPLETCAPATALPKTSQDSCRTVIEATGSAGARKLKAFSAPPMLC